MTSENVHFDLTQESSWIELRKYWTSSANKETTLSLNVPFITFWARMWDAPVPTSRLEQLVFLGTPLAIEDYILFRRSFELIDEKDYKDKPCDTYMAKRCFPINSTTLPWNALAVYFNTAPRTEGNDFHLYITTPLDAEHCMLLSKCIAQNMILSYVSITFAHTSAAEGAAFQCVLDALQHANRVRTLRLIGDPVGCTLNCIANCTLLQELICENVHIPEISFIHMLPCTDAVTAVSFINCALESIAALMLAIKRLPKLRALRLPRNRLTNIMPIVEYLTDPELSLEQLDLASNDISDISALFFTLKDSKSLQHLYMPDNLPSDFTVSCRTIEALKQNTSLFSVCVNSAIDTMMEDTLVCNRWRHRWRKQTSQQ